VAGEAAIHGLMHQSKAAGAWGAAAESSNWGHSRTDGVHSDGGPDESIDGGVIRENAEECLESTTAWLSGTLLEGVESGEPVGGRDDDGWGGSSWESRWRGEEGDEVVCDEVPVGVRDGELAWAGGSTIDDSRDVDVECSETLSSWIEQAVGGEDLNQGKRVVGPDETVFSLESNGNSSHAGISISTLLVLLESDALSV